MKRILLAAICTFIFAAAPFLAPASYAIPENKTPCNTCHAAGGVGTLTVTHIDGTKPDKNIFVVKQGETIGVVLYGVGAKSNSPAVSIVFDSTVHHHVKVKGATAGGDGSYAYYVRDGDKNDQNPDAGNLKGVFEITVDDVVSPNEYELIATYIQGGPSGVNVKLTLKVTGFTRLPSSLNIVVSPLEVFAGKGEVYLSGSVAPKTAKNIVIEYRGEGSGWSSLTIISPNLDGSFLYSWRPENIGSYELKAKFEGDKEYETAESETFTVVVKKAPETFLNQLLTGLSLGLLTMLTGASLFYRAGRKRYLERLQRNSKITPL